MPSTNLFKHGAWVLENHLEKDEVMEFGDPKRYLYRIDLREYAVEIKKLEAEVGFMGYMPLEQSS